MGIDDFIKDSHRIVRESEICAINKRLLGYDNVVADKNVLAQRFVEYEIVMSELVLGFLETRGLSMFELSVYAKGSGIMVSMNVIPGSDKRILLIRKEGETQQTEHSNNR